jgi:uncharacterized protein YecA (UPF0149 family)
MTDRITIALRLAPELHAQLKALADGDQRSLNAFIGRALSNVVARTAPSMPQRLPVPSRIRKVPPNQRCPCGSGTKYKKCCGRAAG